MNLSFLCKAKGIAAALAALNALALVLLAAGAGPNPWALAGLGLALSLAAVAVLWQGKARVRALTAACKRLEQGDFGSRIMMREGGEVGELIWAINDLTDRVDAYVRESMACMDYVSRNHYFRHLSEDGMTGS